MAKQGQHNKDGNDPDVSRGHNNPDKSVTITTGSYKKPETYKKQAAEHKADNKRAQEDKNEWTEDTQAGLYSSDGKTGKQYEGDSARDGSDSNASNGSRG